LGPLDYPITGALNGADDLGGFALMQHLMVAPRPPGVVIAAPVRKDARHRLDEGLIFLLWEDI